MGRDLRAAIEADFAGNRDLEAAARLRELWRNDPSLATARYAVAQFERLRGRQPFLPYKLAILRSFTVEPLIPLLRAEAFAAGIDLEIHVGEFNVWAQEIYDAGSALYAFHPDAVILALEEPEPQGIAEALGEFRRRSAAAVLVHNRLASAWPPLGAYDAQSDDSERESVQALNRELRQTVRGFRSAYVVDYDCLVSRAGSDGWRDARKWAAVRLPMASGHMLALVLEWMRFLQPLAGKIAKCAVVDLDNTLWGGVIGEEGMSGIKVGDAAPGLFFRELQQALLDLTARGVLLAVCSKNNRDEALEALEKHPAMLLRPAHFAALRINWQDKAQNLREIAEELNIGLDALAFLDDNPAERENIRLQLPEVTVIELPPEPENCAAAVRRAPVFERLELSAEDSRRGEMYAAQRERRDAAQTCSSPEDFLRSLEQRVEIAPVTAFNMARVAQLTQKTNQFNLTTRRYNEQEIAAFAARPGWDVLTISVRDRFGDNGLTGVAIVERQADACEIDTLLLSCRVIGRGVETALIAHIEAEARRQGCRTLRGRFIPTKKNVPANGFFHSHGFRETGAEGDAAIWERDLAALPPLAFPDSIQVDSPAEVFG